MELFELRNYQVIVAPQTFMINEFAAIRDKNNDDDLTSKELSYIWFFADIGSDFQNIINEDTRTEEIKVSINMPEDWQPDDKIEEAIAFYKKYSKTASSGLYDASMIAASFIEKKLKNPEALLLETDNRGNPIYTLDKILAMMQKIPDVMKKLHEARLQVIQEIESKTELKGSKQKAMFEDGI